jgi:hypothetical protein
MLIKQNVLYIHLQRPLLFIICAAAKSVHLRKNFSKFNYLLVLWVESFK